jgi:zinc D-Ala-D-Ala dipeptidase
MKLSDILLQPIPDYSADRERKQGYRGRTLAVDTERNHEPLVDIAQYGIAGQGYYSRPNDILGVVEGLSPVIWLRQSVAERLAAINSELQRRADEFTELLGSKVELYVEEGLRPQALQKKLYDEVYPERIRLQHPTMKEKDVLAQRDELIAKPSNDEESPSPHATGAAMDVSLRIAQPELGYVAKARLPLGKHRFHTEHESYPDYFEHKRSLSVEERTLQQNRRIFYWIMRGALTHDGSGFCVNPTEWWHWAYGDQMWAVLTHAPLVLFSAPPTDPMQRAR